MSGRNMSSTEDLSQLATGYRPDRRSLLKGAAGLGLVIPGIGVLGVRGAFADDSHASDATPGADHDAAASKLAQQPVQPFALFDPVLQPVEAGPKEITLTAKDEVLYIAKDVAYAAWTFDGTIPSPFLRVVEGDTINFTLKIDPDVETAHSIDFHSAKTPPDKSYVTVMPGEEHSFSFEAKYPGPYMYHCGTPPILMHIATGMYGGMIVDPKEGWSPAQEFAFVQSEFYTKDAGNGVLIPDYTKMLGHGAMDYVTFNGYANQYAENPIAVKAGEPVRVFVVNAGPNIWSSFHVVGTIFDAAYVNGNPKNKLTGLQSMSIGPGDGAVVEFVLDEPGTYPFVNHSFGHASHGAVGLFIAE